MANKRASSPDDPLKPFMIYITQSQILFLKNLGKSASGFVRTLITAQINSIAPEISQLKQEIVQTEAHLKIQYAQLKELEDDNNRQQDNKKLEAELFKSRVETLVLTLKSYHGDMSEIRNGLNATVTLIKEKTGTDYTVDEVKDAVIKKAVSEGVEIYETQRG